MTDSAPRYAVHWRNPSTKGAFRQGLASDTRYQSKSRKARNCRRTLLRIAKAFASMSIFEVRQRPDSGGALHFYRQCLRCAQSIGSALKKTPELADCPPWKEDHAEKFNVPATRNIVRSSKRMFASKETAMNALKENTTTTCLPRMAR
ncbi:hypothetical protein [Bradyrhizobium sp. 162]|uniref:hypothetical protein n=1 Tax=Bradyrhizobium sp. 162 TaxID=2782635 RepID=UPI001FFA097E|nr:hypothetical protein [Bradyrhizobium sp. 162]MCK1634605.1 hypothetical protein [Bradyrhizobium sp. 162]